MLRVQELCPDWRGGVSPWKLGGGLEKRGSLGCYFTCKCLCSRRICLLTCTLGFFLMKREFCNLLRSTLLNKQWIKQEIRVETRQCFELCDYEIMTYSSCETQLKQYLEAQSQPKVHTSSFLILHRYGQRWGGTGLPCFFIT